MIYSANSADRELGHQYVHELLAEYPDWASPHGLQGFIYYKRWQSTKSKEDGDKAIAEYQQCLSLDTLEDKDFHNRVQQVITEIQRG